MLASTLSICGHWGRQNVAVFCFACMFAVSQHILKVFVVSNPPTAIATMVRIAALALFPVVFAAKAHTDISGVIVYTSANAKCDAPSTAPSAVHVKMDQCFVHGTGSVKFNTCSATVNKVMVFTDAACATLASTASVDISPTSICTTVLEADLTIAKCEKMSCDGTATAMTCVGME